MSRVLIAGCGYVGTALGLELSAEGHEVWGLRRGAAGLPPPLVPIEADLTHAGVLGQALEGRFDQVVYAASSDGRDERAYRDAYERGPQNLLAALAAPPSRLVFVSSTGVYAQSDGEWVDETSETSPTENSGRCLLAGEGVVRASGVDAVVVRFGGIYGPGRTRLMEKVRAGEARVPSHGPRWSNRIHRDDCAGVIRHLLELERPDPLYLGVDHEPADLAEVQRWLAAELGAPEPTVGGEDDAMSSRRRRSNKRCDSSRLRASGYRFRYPTFREGYRALLAVSTD